MKNRNLVKIIFSILLLASTKLYAENWHICFGSFGNRSNAAILEQKLNENNFNSFITEYRKNENEILYRVLFQQNFSTKYQCLEKMRQIEHDAAIENLGIENLWCVDLPEIASNTIPAVHANTANNERNEVLVERFIEVIKEVPTETVREVTVEKITVASESINN